MKAVDVYILTGFVGAGKTTALNGLLGDKTLASGNPALIINEFGKIGVDGALVQQRDLTRYEINKGSIFCICTKTDFLKALTEIAESGKHQTLLIEATGIAETCDIESFLDAPNITSAFNIRGNLCIIDAANFTRVAAFLKTAVAQVQQADALVINKTDMVSEEELTMLNKILDSMNPDAVKTCTQFGKIEADFLSRIQHTPHDAQAIEQPPADIIAVSVSGDRPYDRDRFYEVLDELKDNLLRLKGNIDFGSGPRFVELAGTKVTEVEASDELTKQNKTPTAFTAIAWEIDKDTLHQKLTLATCHE